jgi:hypothetical protein
MAEVTAGVDGERGQVTDPLNRDLQRAVDDVALGDRVQIQAGALIDRSRRGAAESWARYAQGDPDEVVRGGWRCVRLRQFPQGGQFAG